MGGSSDHRNNDRAAEINAARAEFEGLRNRAAVAAGIDAGSDRSTSRMDWLAQSLPSYDIGPEIHRGGQGVVYKSVQRGTNRPVAIKVMHDGPFGGPRQIARFEREVQILGQLKHPNIVTIHESGNSGDGFYFVMDYIEGDTLDAYVAKKNLSVRETLALFAKVCDAVNVAHLRGVIHRDIKPANIRVDRSGEPHILDFGLAKVNKDDVLADTRTAAFSVTGQFIGSLPWASPEQVDSSPSDIDIRTDVYSLGVTLFQILTQRFPYDVDGQVRKILDNICRAEPSRPSSHRGDVGEEVDAIVLTCLRKDKALRYQSAGDLSRDIKNYLRGDPIEAKRDSGWYVFRKTARRYRFPVAIVLLLFLVITGALVTSLAFWQQAVRDRDAAEVARTQADQARTEAQEQEKIAKSVVGFLTRDVLEQLDPYNTQGEEVTAKALFDQAAADIDAGKFADEPKVEFEIRTTLGLVYVWMSEYPKSAAQFRPALKIARAEFGDEDEKTLQTMRRLGTALSGMGKIDEAEPLLREALEIQLRTLGPEHLSTVLSKSSLAGWYEDANRPEEAEKLYREALEVRNRLQGPEHSDSLAVKSKLASTIATQGQLDKAAEILQETIEAKRRVHGNEHPETQLDVMQYASILAAQGKIDEAYPLAKESRELLEKAFGPRHDAVRNSMMVMAQIHEAKSEWAEAEAQYRQALDIQREKGFGNSASIRLVTIVANLLSRQGKHDEAEQMLRELLASLDLDDSFSNQQIQILSNLVNILSEARKFNEAMQVAIDTIELCKKTEGEDSFRTVVAKNNLAFLYMNLGKLPEAEQMFREALASQERMEGSDEYLTLNLMHNLSLVLGKLGHDGERRELLEKVLERRRDLLGERDANTLKTIHALATAYRDGGRLAEAETLYREAVNLSEELWPDGNTLTEHFRRGLGTCLTAMGRYEEAEKTLLQCFEFDDATLKPDHPNRIEGIEKLIQLYEAWNKPEKADQWRDKLHEIPE